MVSNGDEIDIIVGNGVKLATLEAKDSRFSIHHPLNHLYSRFEFDELYLNIPTNRRERFWNSDWEPGRIGRLYSI